MAGACEERPVDSGTGRKILLKIFPGRTLSALHLLAVCNVTAGSYSERHNSRIRRTAQHAKINSVSGVSFTAAYYGLFGDKIFEEYKDDFLCKEIEGELTGRIFKMFYLLERQFTAISRTEDAVSFYDEEIFRGKTFGDYQRSDGPFIAITSTDLNSHDQFVFTQGYFDFLCSDLSQFKVARAVAASSAVPVLFEPILIENHHSCNFQKPIWLNRDEQKALQENDLRLQELVKSLGFYLAPAKPPYFTLVDGDVTDNLGLRVILNNNMLFEETTELYSILKRFPKIKHLAVLVLKHRRQVLQILGKVQRWRQYR